MASSKILVTIKIKLRKFIYKKGRKHFLARINTSGGLSGDHDATLCLTLDLEHRKQQFSNVLRHFHQPRKELPIVCLLVVDRNIALTTRL